MTIPFRFLFQPVRQFEKQFQGFRLNLGDGFESMHSSKEADFIRDFRQGLHLRLHGGDGGVQNRESGRPAFKRKGVPGGQILPQAGR